MYEPSGWLPSHETIATVVDRQAKANCTFAPCGYTLPSVGVPITICMSPGSADAVAGHAPARRTIVSAARRASVFMEDPLASDRTHLGSRPQSGYPPDEPSLSGFP